MYKIQITSGDSVGSADSGTSDSGIYSSADSTSSDTGKGISGLGYFVPFGSRPYKKKKKKKKKKTTNLQAPKAPKGDPYKDHR